MSTAPQAQLDPSAVIGQAFAMYKDHVSVLLPAALAIYAVQGIAGIVFASSAAGALVLMVFSVALSMIFSGAIVQLVRDAQDGVRDSTVSQLAASVVPVLLPLLGVGIVSALVIGIGFVLLIVPGLYAMTLLAVAGPVTVLERPGVFAALSRSRQLVHGSGWQVFGVMLFVIVLGMAAGMIAAAIGAPLSEGGAAVVQWIVTAALAPFGGLATATAYLRLRDVHGEAPLPAGAAS